MKKIFVDTSAWYAYARADDPDHDAVSEVLERWEGRLVTSNFVFDETVTLVRYRLGLKAAERVGKVLLSPGAVEFVRLLPEDEEAAWKFFLAHSDKDFSMTDCTSFALMKRLAISAAATTDHHFRQAGFQTEP